MLYLLPFILSVYAVYSVAAPQNDSQCSILLSSITSSSSAYCQKLGRDQKLVSAKTVQCLKTISDQYLDENFFSEEDVNFGVPLLAGILSGCIQPETNIKLNNPYFNFIGLKIMGPQKEFNGYKVGGLSGLVYDSGTNSLLVVSDDPGRNDPSRYFKITPDFDSSISFPIQAVTLLHKNLDAEGITLLENKQVLISYETLFPFSQALLNVFNQDGTFSHELHAPSKFSPLIYSGVRMNKAFESLTSLPGTNLIFTANEAPLYQDQLPDRDVVRIIRKDLSYSHLQKNFEEFTYQLEPGNKNGLVDMVALNEDKILTLERNYNTETDHTTVRIFAVDLKNAKDYSGIYSLKDESIINRIKLVPKKLLISLDELLPILPVGLKRIDNFEGMTLGPRLRNGHHSLVLVTDNNFKSPQQTQFLVLELKFLDRL